jgi:phage N-6-adenine-methyltransferase
VYQLLEAAEVERNISTIVEKSAIPESQLRPLSRLEPEQQREAWARVVETAQDGKITAAHVQGVVDDLYGDDDIPLQPQHLTIFDEHGSQESITLEPDEELIVVKQAPHVSHNSGNNEWYTPSEYIEAARVVMGKIDLDPASSVIANQIVMADKFYTADDDGLSKEWRGKIWMNPPYSADLIWQFAAKIRKHYQAGDVTEAIVLVNNATETAWFYDMAQAASAIAFTHSRVKYLNESLEPKGAPLQGQAVIYFGKNVKKFRQAFDDLCWSAAL